MHWLSISVSGSARPGHCNLERIYYCIYTRSDTYASRFFCFILIARICPGSAQKGLNLQQGQILVIAAPVEAHDFVTILTREAYEAGARQVVMNWRSDASARLRYEYEDLSEFTTMPDWRREFSLCYYRQNAAFLSLISANPYLMKGIDMQKLVAWQKASNKALKEYIDGMMASRTTWLVAAVPSLVWAHILYPDQPEETAYEMLWKQILQSSRADGENPLADWDAHLLELKKRRDWMTSQHFTSLHYTSGQGTDLTIGLSEKHIWQGGAEETTSHILFNANIPTEEIYTAPDASRVNGIVYSTRPLVYNGNLIDNFYITFKDGRAIESKAETGDDVLKQILSMDEGASRLGEVALIPYHSLFLCLIFSFMKHSLMKMPPVIWHLAKPIRPAFPAAAGWMTRNFAPMASMIP